MIRVMADPDDTDPREPVEAADEAPEQGGDDSDNPTSDGGGNLKAAGKGKARRRRRSGDSLGFERIAEVHYCRGDDEANQYLALGPEWDLQDIVPMRVETEDGGERDEIHFIVARWENDRDRARLRARDRRIPGRGK